MTTAFIMKVGGNMEVKPLFDRVIVLPIKEQNTQTNGLILPETASNKPEMGKVMAVGDGTNFDGDKIEMKVKQNERVLFNKLVADEIIIDNKTHYILRQIDILGVVYD